MFSDSKVLQAMEGGLNAAWMQQQLHLQNLANVSTGGYKAKSMVFEKVLDASQKQPVYQAKIVESKDVSLRPDGNNVNTDIESMELYKAYAQYSMLLDKIKGEFTNYETVLNCSMK